MQTNQKSNDIPLPANIEEQVLQTVVVLLVTVSEEENLAVHCYLKPLDDHNNVFKFSKYNEISTECTLYYIGKYGACPAAIRNIPVLEMHGGAMTEFIMMACQCFPNLSAVIAVGVAYGVENKVNLCDVLVSSSVRNYYGKMILQEEATPPSNMQNTSPYLGKLFRKPVEWPNESIKNRLEDSGIGWPKIHSGTMLSGSYITDDPEIENLIKSFASEIIGVEVEATNLMVATQQTNLQAIIVKAVCDYGNGNKLETYQPTAALLAADCVSTFLSHSKVPKKLKQIKGFESKL